MGPPSLTTICTRLTRRKDYHALTFGSSWLVERCWVLNPSTPASLVPACPACTMCQTRVSLSPNATQPERHRKLPDVLFHRVVICSRSWCCCCCCFLHASGRPPLFHNTSDTLDCGRKLRLTVVLRVSTGKSDYWRRGVQHRKEPFVVDNYDDWLEVTSDTRAVLIMLGIRWLRSLGIHLLGSGQRLCDNGARVTLYHGSTHHILVR